MNDKFRKNGECRFFAFPERLNPKSISLLKKFLFKVSVKNQKKPPVAGCCFTFDKQECNLYIMQKSIMQICIIAGGLNEPVCFWQGC
jgi:hypothetical protein